MEQSVDIGFLSQFKGADTLLLSCTPAGIDSLANLAHSLSAPDSAPVAVHLLPYVTAHGVSLEAKRSDADVGIHRPAIISPGSVPRMLGAPSANSCYLCGAARQCISTWTARPTKSQSCCPSASTAKVCGTVRANPSLQPTCYGWLRQPTQAAEPKR